MNQATPELRPRVIVANVADRFVVHAINDPGLSLFNRLASLACEWLASNNNHYADM
jgi:hypothetical protein